jgi:hypothetical protein
LIYVILLVILDKVVESINSSVRNLGAGGNMSQGGQEAVNRIDQVESNIQ